MKINRFFYKSLFLVLLSIFALASIASVQKVANMPASNAAVAVGADPQVRKIVAANTEFGLKVLGQLSRNAPDKNVFFSPFGISNALTMALDGAGGATAHDMASTLGLVEMTQDQINSANGLFLPSLKKPDPKVELSVANALWIDPSATFNAGFQDRSQRFYAARVDTLDLGSPDAPYIINGWAKESTHGKIDPLVSPSDLMGAAVVLANVVYFHGTWQHKFLKASTTAGPFILDTSHKKTLPLMSLVEKFPYLETPDFQAISLPYGAGRLSLFIFLPKPGSDLNTFVNGLSMNSWEGWIAKMQPTEMNFTLPRFRVNCQTNLTPSLTALGMASAFSLGADFTPMGLHGPFINTVIHKAILEVDEDGTVAAAATQITFGFAGGGPRPVLTVMRVDRPFVCAIRDSATGTLLFAGVIRDPN